MDIYHLNSVVVIEMQNVMVPSNDVAGKSYSKLMPSQVYSETAYERGYTGDGVVIAILQMQGLTMSIVP